MRGLAMLGVLGFLPAVVMCGGSSSSGPSTCVPGTSIACVGPGGCSSDQLCKDDGSGYGPCTCAASGGTDASQGNDASSGDGGGADSNGDDSSVADATSEADAPPFSPSQLSGLALWLESGVGVVADPAAAGAVKRWLDQSGNGNDATEDGSNHPIVDPAAKNGHDGIVCDLGSQFYITDSTSLDFGTGAFAVTFALKNLDPSGVGAHYWQKTQSNPSVTFWLSSGPDTYHALVGDQSVTTAGSNDDHFLILTVRGPTVQIRLNGVATTGATTALDVSNAGGGVVLGTKTELLEVIALKGTASDTDVDNVEAYLKGKFKL